MYLVLIITLLIIWGIMWVLFKFMYPKPPQAFMPKEGDVITPRACDYCGYPLAEYRGVLEEKPEAALTKADKAEIARLSEALEPQNEQSPSVGMDDATQLGRKQKKQAQLAKQKMQEERRANQQALKKLQTWFFCNYEHQADFHQQLQHPQKQQQTNS